MVSVYNVTPYKNAILIATFKNYHIFYIAAHIYHKQQLTFTYTMQNFITIVEANNANINAYM